MPDIWANFVKSMRKSLSKIAQSGHTDHGRLSKGLSQFAGGARWPSLHRSHSLARLQRGDSPQQIYLINAFNIVYLLLCRGLEKANNLG